jgi:hypothetical protein
MAEKRLFPNEGVTAREEPEEVLIADPRGGMAPAQMVDLKLLALLRGGNPGLCFQAAGRLNDIRMIPREQKAAAPGFGNWHDDTAGHSDESGRRRRDMTGRLVAV